MSDTTTRGDGVIVDRGTASTGTLPRPVSPARKESPVRQGKESPVRQGRVPSQDRTRRPEREEARTPRPRAPRPARPDEAGASPRTAPVPSQARRPRTAPPRARRTQDEPRRPAEPRRPQAEPQPKRIRTAAPQAPQTAPKAATQAAPKAAPKTAGTQAGSRLRGVSPAATNRMPFIVLLCGLLGGALASALVISTTLAEGSFEISKLQQSDSSLARQRQQLQDQVSQAQSAPSVQQRAYELGMRPASQLQFLNLKTGKVENGSGSAASASAASSAANETGPGAAVRNP